MDRDFRRRFEAQWRDGQRPRVWDYLPTASHPQFQQIALKLIKLDIGWRLRSGDSAPVVDDYFQRPSVRMNNKEKVELIAFEYHRRWLRGETDVRWADYVARYQETTGAMGQLVPLWDCPDCGKEDIPLPDEEAENAECPWCTNTDKVINLFKPPVEQAFDLRKYPLGELLGTGGMAEVYRCSDPVIGRELAIKVLLAKHRGCPGVRGRFLEEARILGQLKHPAIVPIHNLGRLPDGRPFFTMKWVEEITLADRLNEETTFKGSPPQQLIDSFRLLCQAVAYAHGKGIIHRDIKPANVMVSPANSANTTVQLMDWGLAKDLGSKQDLDSETNDQTILPTLTSADHTSPGDVLGTFCYLPPEQARGEIELIKQHSDVFGLGAVFCEILTGKPPYWFSSDTECPDKVVALKRAKEPKLQDAYQRLDRCGADQELIDLAKQCLSPSPEQRPASGNEVLEGINQYLEGIQKRLQQEITERAAAKARAEEEKKRFEAVASEKEKRLEAVIQEEQKRRKVFRWATGVVVSLLLLIGLGGWRYISEAMERSHQEAMVQVEEEARQEKTRQDISRMLNEIPPLRDRYQFNAAEALLNQADSQAQALPDSDKLRALVAQARKDLAMVRELDRIRQEKMIVVNSSTKLTYSNAKDGEYIHAFENYGLDIFQDNFDQTAQQIRNSAIWMELVNALDSWRSHENCDLVAKLTTVLRKADDNHVRNKLRNRDFRVNHQGNKELLDQINLDLIIPGLADYLVHQLTSNNQRQSAIDLLRKLSGQHPADFWIHHYLALLLSSNEGIGHYRAALVVRPQSTVALNNLGLLLMKLERLVEAEESFRIAIAIDPHNPNIQNNMGLVLKKRNKFDEATQAFRTAIEINPQHVPAHKNLGALLSHMNRSPDAEELYRQLLEIAPDDANTHFTFSMCLINQDKTEKAVASLCTVIEIDPGYIDAYFIRGLSLVGLGRISDAEQDFRTVIDKQPTDLRAYEPLAIILTRKLKLVEALKTLQAGKKVAQVAGDKESLANFDSKIKMMMRLMKWKSLVAPRPE